MTSFKCAGEEEGNLPEETASRKNVKTNEGYGGGTCRKSDPPCKRWNGRSESSRLYLRRKRRSEERKK